MRHPFDGIVPSSRRPEPAADAAKPLPHPARRSVLGALAALATGAVGGLLASPREAAAQTMTTQALEEEGGGSRYRVFPPPGQGGYPPGLDGSPPPGHGGMPPGLRRRWGATTQALGEEGGPPGRGRWGRRVTTQALGEEGGWQRGHGLATTEALGEEGAGGGWPRF